MSDHNFMYILHKINVQRCDQLQACLWSTHFAITVVLGLTGLGCTPTPGDNWIFPECAPRICFGVRILWLKYLCEYIALEILPQLPRHPPNTLQHSQHSGVFADEPQLLPHHPFPAAQLSGSKRKEHVVVWRI